MVYDLIDGQFVKQGDKVFGTDIAEQLLFSESFRSIRNRLPFWDEHLDLMNFQFQLLNRQLPDVIKNKGRELNRQLERTLVKNKLFKSARIDVAFFDTGNHTGYLAKAKTIDAPFYEFNQEGLILDIFSRTSKSSSPLSALRMGSYPYWKILRAFQSSDLTEMVLQNERGCLLEAPERNLYLVQGINVHTVAPGSGSYLDPARETILRICRKTGLVIHENEFLDAEDLLHADEVFLAGEIHGIQWVKGFGMKRYRCKAARKLNDLLNRELEIE